MLRLTFLKFSCHRHKLHRRFFRKAFFSQHVSLSTLNVGELLKPKVQKKQSEPPVPKIGIDVDFVLNASENLKTKVQKKQSEPPVPKTGIDVDFVLNASGNSPFWATSPVCVEISQTDSVEKALSIVEKYPLSFNQASNALTQVKQFNNVPFVQLIVDSRLLKCISIVLEADLNDQLTMMALFRSFTTLLALGLPVKHEISDQFRTKINQGLQKDAVYSIGSLVNFACNYVDYDAEMDPKTKTEFMLNLEAFLATRIGRLNTKNVSLLLSILNKLCPYQRRNEDSLLREVEALLVASCEKMTSVEAAYAIEYLTNAKSRFVHLIKLLSMRVVINIDRLKFKQQIQLLNSLVTQKYCSMFIVAPLLEGINKNLPTKLNSETLLEQLLYTLSKGNIRSPQTFALLLDHVYANYASFSAENLMLFVNTLAQCNYAPKHFDHGRDKTLDEILLNMQHDLTLKSIDDKKFIWLKYIWSLSILDRLTVDFAATVLNESYLKRLMEIENPFMSSFARTKVLNIYSSVCYDLKNTKNDRNITDPTRHVGFLDGIMITPSARKASAIDEFLSTLFLLAPENTYCKTRRLLPEGYIVDAEIYVDKSGKPVPVSEWPSGGTSASKGDNAQTVDSDATEPKRTVFVVRDFDDETLISQSLIGRHAIADRHLAKMGCSVKQIPVSNLFEKTNALRMVTDLKAELFRSSND